MKIPVQLFANILKAAAGGLRFCMIVSIACLLEDYSSTCSLLNPEQEVEVSKNTIRILAHYISEHPDAEVRDLYLRELERLATYGRHRPA